jgi:hypothetical protein
MARMPGAVWLGEHGSADGLISRYDIVCVHTIVGYAPAHAAHFSTHSTGQIGQSRDTKYRSAANYNGNHRIIAIENEDFGPPYGPWSGSDVPGFTAAQMESIAQILAWAYHTHGIPLVLCPDSRPGSRGIAYHRQGIDGNWAGFDFGGRVTGGEVWTKSTGKVCPGDRRIHQLIDVIIPRARRIAGLDGGPPVPKTQIPEEGRYMDLKLGANRSAVLTAPGTSGYQIQVGSEWTTIDVHKIEFRGRPGSTGIPYVGTQFRPDGGHYVVQPGRDLYLDVPADAISVSIIYSISDTETKFSACAGFTLKG